MCGVEGALRWRRRTPVGALPLHFFAAFLLVFFETFFALVFGFVAFFTAFFAVFGAMLRELGSLSPMIGVVPGSDHGSIRSLRRKLRPRHQRRPPE